MDEPRERISMQELAKLVESSLIASAQEAARLAKMTNAPLISIDHENKSPSQTVANEKEPSPTQR